MEGLWGLVSRLDYTSDTAPVPSGLSQTTPPHPLHLDSSSSSSNSKSSGFRDNIGGAGTRTSRIMVPLGLTPIATAVCSRSCSETISRTSDR